jgi:predicted acetyltransferase
VTDDAIRIEVPTEADWPEYSRLLTTAFHEEVEEEIRDQEKLLYEPRRSLVARRDGRIVGTAAISTRQLAVPGAVIPAGHVTFVSVAATARRQGVLSRFMRQQFDDIRAAGEPIAILWASEGRIYQRFGYGMAARKLAFKVDTREVRVIADQAAGRLIESAPAEALDAMTKIYDQLYAEHPGWSERSAPHWEYRIADKKSARGGYTELRALLHEGDAGPDGYALWSAHAKWDEGGPCGELRVRELVATTPRAYAALWQHLLSMDLTRTATTWVSGLDEPLLYMVNEPRRLGITVSDSIWLRVLDVPAALAARRYAAPVDAVIEVTDAIITSNSGRFRLRGSTDGATCEPTTDPADLVCSINALGAAYLGDASLTTLADAGMVREARPGTLAAASTAFGWPRPAYAIEPI